MIGVFGGSFDPPHLGHQALVKCALDLYPEMKTFFIVPNALSPWKTQKYFPASQILRLCELNFGKLDPKIEISSLEIELPPPSYTVDSILQFRKIDPEILLFLGSDSWDAFPQWKSSEIIYENCTKIIVFQRKNTNSQDPKRFSEKLVLVSNPSWDYESSTIRNLPLLERKNHLDADVFNEILKWENSVEKL